MSCLPFMNSFTLSQYSWEMRESLSLGGINTSLRLSTSSPERTVVLICSRQYSMYQFLALVVKGGGY